MVLTLELVGIVCSAIMIAIGIVLWVMTQFDKRDKETEVVRIDGSREIAKLRDELSTYKLYVSENFATKGGVSESFQQVVSSIDRLSTRIDKLMTVRSNDFDNRN